MQLKMEVSTCSFGIKSLRFVNSNRKVIFFITGKKIRSEIDIYNTLLDLTSSVQIKKNIRYCVSLSGIYRFEIISKVNGQVVAKQGGFHSEVAANQALMRVKAYLDNLLLVLKLNQHRIKEVIINLLKGVDISMQNQMNTVETKSELHKFFVVAEAYKQATGDQANMPSCIVDSCWHELQKSPESYEKFCMNAVGKKVKHEENKGEGVIPWVDTYKALFGELDERWFIKPDGNIDLQAKTLYLQTGVLKMSWDCTPN